MSSDTKFSDVKTPLRPIARNRERLEPTSDINELHARLRADPRFNPPTPSLWKRVALLIIVCVLFWLGFHLRKPLRMEQEIVQAKRSGTVLSKTGQEH